ncbi:hypothetical protein BRADI_3g51430v3 [Brachypodium distachyon]|uniref:Mitochondrial import inner membrane translocase subunit TIM22 n=2 Tax=Brachypodium distachyon TaxID=15368 RepID=I1ICI2_BRADI|nr:hypothetical protein BRADI_3g51430v3 [Brachypodium distachyon]
MSHDDAANIPAPGVDGRRQYVLDRPAFGRGAQLLYDLPTSPEFLFEEEALRKNRTWGENLTFYTGVGFCAGSLTGGARGLGRAIAAAERGESAKLRLSRALNECGSVGRKHGNRLGVIGLLFGGAESAVRHFRDDQDDWITTVSAGVGTGAIYGCPSGPRAAVVRGIVGGVLAGASTAVKPLLEKFAPDLAARFKLIS